MLKNMGKNRNKKNVNNFFIYQRISIILVGTITIHVLFKNLSSFSVSDNPNMRNHEMSSKNYEKLFLNTP